MNKLVEKGWLPRQPCEIWSRVMGYYRPVSLWNVGKQAEYRERVQLDPKKICD
ncbi:MAG: anaerobic ribonucleoside-triphosphate reductase [Candidatus Riflebacteria bacterium]|nr:anaerobic ribonucleoside-triphosphate reductase [Candidatus Riflebacteria bacterium]